MPAYDDDRCSDTVFIDDDPAVRSINEAFVANGFLNYNEGEYRIKITGYNSVYSSNIMEVYFIWKLLADCGSADTTITRPTTIWSNPLISTTHSDGTQEDIDYSREY